MVKTPLKIIQKALLYTSYPISEYVCGIVNNSPADIQIYLAWRLRTIRTVPLTAIFQNTSRSGTIRIKKSSNIKKNRLNTAFL